MERKLMQLRNLSIPTGAVFAPMAGLTDAACRHLMADHGAAWTVSEMASAKALNFHDEKSLALLRDKHPHGLYAIQLFGAEPESMAKAILFVREQGIQFDILDINMGCPAPKIAGNHCGSALMREPELCRRIVRAVAEAVEVPVTAKIRKGYGRDEVNAVEVAQACAAGGAAAITVHGRTREQMYAPPVDWEIIRRVKEAVDIPVIGNGDVTSAAQAAALYEQTGCDLVMVGRGALGAPWLFAQINAYLQEGRVLPDPPVAKRMAVLLRQISLAVAYKGERVAMREARKHAAWYMRGLRGAAGLRARAGTLETFDDLRRLCEAVMQENARQEAP